MFKIKICLIFLFFCSLLSAQVTIGSENPPEKYATLQIDGKGKGLRLNRLSTSERNALNAESNADKRLTYLQHRHQNAGIL